MRSMVAALLEEEHDATPSHVLRRLNGAFFDSVQHRLRRDDYATLCLLRFDPDGRVTYAGAHEDILVYRAQTRRAQRLATNGVWVGVVPDVSDLMPDESFVLDPEDVVVLHTDGLTEAMDSQKERFEMARVIDIVECRHGAAVEEIRDALIDAAVSYSPLQRDDITVVVIRYQPPRASPRHPD
jgi:phosphoserine phosphatase RsbU/P